MLKKVSLYVLTGILTLGLAACSEAPQTQTTQPEAAAPPPPPAPEPVYEITKDEITKNDGWTGKNVSVLGLKIGDRTTEKEKALGVLDNTRTLPDEYLTIYQGNGVFVFTKKLTGRASAIEIYETFAKKVSDPRLAKLLTSGDLKLMRELMGQEEGMEESTEGDPATSYLYDSRGFRVIKYKVRGRTITAIRFAEPKKTT